MIVDIRTYVCQPGKMQAWLKLYEEFAWPLQKKYLGNCLGFYVSTDGRLNNVVHLWGYESQADREARRGALAADPDWGIFLGKAAALGAFISQENSFFKPAPFYSAE